MQALNSREKPTWKRRAVVRVGAVLQAVCVSAAADERIQVLEHDADVPAPDSDTLELNDVTQLTSSLWYVLAFIEKICQALLKSMLREMDLCWRTAQNRFWIPSQLLFHVCKYLRTKASVMFK
jgi:hypothetical protein